MALTYTILPDIGLVYVRYSGVARFEDTQRVFGEYLRDPNRRPGQKQIVDLSDITGIERDFAKLMDMQARKADAFADLENETHIVYLAPTETASRLAQSIAKSWEPFPNVIVSVIDNEADALEVLGVKDVDLAALTALAR